MIECNLIPIEDFWKKYDYDSEQQISKAVQPSLSELNDPKTVGDFLNSITSIAFAELLEEFGFEMQLIIFLIYRGYCAKEVSKITGIPEWTICRRLAKLNYANPIVGMGLFMDADGFPLSFDLFPGNQNEQLTLKDHEHKVINDFQCSQFVYCSDSGLGSKKNRLLNTTGGRAYVITQSLKKLKKMFEKQLFLHRNIERLVPTNSLI